MLSTSAQSSISLEGYFIALESCEAFQSKNSRTNPGDTKTSVMMAYEIQGRNKPNGDYFQIVVPNAPVTQQRWVSVDCGSHVVVVQKGVAETPLKRAQTNDIQFSPGAESSNNVLALSWQPAFCETRPGKAECKELNNGNLPETATQLSIHGLWAQPRKNTYCGVSTRLRLLDLNSEWDQLPEPVLSDETRQQLSVVMPGTASLLHRHEWIKHGTCHRGEGGAEEYYADTLLLTRRINNSPVSRYLAAHVGESVATQDIRDKFDQAFGEGAGKRVQFDCKGDQGRVLLQELTIHLSGIINSDADLGELMRAAKPVPLGCPKGVIDPIGLQ